ncbi:MAG: DUF5107 domain-containing protein [Verrucomicrobiaceae bacterium]|nr:DUF5107 domain-containing protein [Verrucomicrobiaceae bacterium]
MKKTLTITSVLAMLAFAVPTHAEVKAWEGELELPSYQLNAPEKAPIFECDWSYQRARRSVYPYALNDNMTLNRKNQKFKALYLENEYVKLCVLPEIGGRLFYAIDKTNGYDIFYHQDVIKPANVGMTGAWISGGVEWNVFHHHRSTSHIPSDYRIETSPDGSKTIWIGETELRHRMSWAIGITLHPKKSYMEISGRLINSTHNSNSMLYWSNVSTRVDENYQIIFPQNTEFGTFHCKNSFCHWPITKEAFTNVEEYKFGVNASWWKDHPSGNSIFVHDLKDDFIAGYDHGKKAGTMLVGNHHIVKGGKFWSWGPNSGWPTKILTDTAGHYIELMQGAYSDNQPDYNWTYPYETKTFTKYWYGIRDIKGVKKGSKVAALNMEVLANNKVFLGVNATEELKNVKITLLKNGKSQFEKTFDISPNTPFVETVSVDGKFKENDLTVLLTSANGKTLLRYNPVVVDASKPLPPIVDRPKLPKDIANNEECYLVGLRNLQFHNPYIKPTDYFMEVLRRDPADTRANTQMGVYWRLRGDNVQAEKYLRKAMERQMKDYTRPKDCEATYNLGLVLKAEGRIDEAMEYLYRAIWNYPFNSAGNFQLAQIYSTQGDFDMAIDRLNEAITYNGNNLPALNLKATILRKLGNTNEAKAIVERILKFSPVNSYAMREKQIMEGGSDFTTLMRDEVESYIELALKYMHNGFDSDAIELLKYIDSKKEYPTVKMWLGYFAEKAGDVSQAKSLYKKALKLPVDYCNPFRLETLKLLRNIEKYYPNSDVLHYYLGNILYDKQQLAGMAEWKKCLELNPEYTMAWRNLGYANWKYTKDFAESAKCYAKAISLDKSQPLFFEEYDQVLEAMGADVKMRYDILKANHKIAEKRYYPLANEVITGTFVGDYDYVLKLLKECYFPTREGVANFHDVYVDALLLAGKAKLNEGNLDEALARYNDAFKFPDNHQVFVFDTRRPRDAQIYYFIGEAYEKFGDKAKAMQNYKKATEVNVKYTEYRYWQGQAFQKLGHFGIARALFDTLKNEGDKAFVTSYVNFYGAEGTTGKTVEGINSKAHYIRGLGLKGLKRCKEANEDFKASLKLKPSTLWSKVMLEEK